MAFSFRLGDATTDGQRSDLKLSLAARPRPSMPGRSLAAAGRVLVVVGVRSRLMVVGFVLNAPTFVRVNQSGVAVLMRVSIRAVIEFAEWASAMEVTDVPVLVRVELGRVEVFVVGHIADHGLPFPRANVSHPSPPRGPFVDSGPAGHHNDPVPQPDAAAAAASAFRLQVPFIGSSRRGSSRRPRRHSNPVS